MSLNPLDRGKVRLTGRLIASGRALVGISAEDLAAACGLSAETLTHLEASGSAWVCSSEQASAIKHGLDQFGIVIVEESDSMGAGVRLKFTRGDVRQIARLEGEGGMIGADDAP